MWRSPNPAFLDGVVQPFDAEAIFGNDTRETTGSMFPLTRPRARWAWDAEAINETCFPPAETLRSFAVLHLSVIEFSCASGKF